MRRRATALRLAIVVSVAVALPACRVQPESVAAAGAPPLGPASADVRPFADTPVGPLPGPRTSAAETPNPFAGDPVSIAEGRRLFVYFNCAGCHGDHGGGGMGPSLRDQAWMYGGSPASVADSIAEGRAHGMPAWGDMLTTAQIWKLAAYIGSMRTSQEAQPPDARTGG